jgi:hypothetical protein
VSVGSRQVSHSYLTDWLDDTGPREPSGDTQWTLTCMSGLQQTGWTSGTRLRIRRLGVRVPPSALDIRSSDNIFVYGYDSLPSFLQPVSHRT